MRPCNITWTERHVLSRINTQMKYSIYSITDEKRGMSEHDNVAPLKRQTTTGKEKQAI